MNLRNKISGDAVPHHILNICLVITPSSMCSLDSSEEDNGQKQDDGGTGKVLRVSQSNEDGIHSQIIKKLSIWMHNNIVPIQ